MKFKLIPFKHKPKQMNGLECLNCGKPLRADDKFCSYCSQKNTVKKITFGTFINNLFSGFLSYDSRFWRTFIPLLTNPGEVSKKYIAGKRARFVNPFRLYLNVSIIFFLTLGFTNKINELGINNIVKTTQTIDSIAKDKEQIDSILTKTKEEIIKNNPNDSTSLNAFEKLDGIINTNNKEYDKPKDYHIKTDTTGVISFSNKIEDFIDYHKKNTNQKSKIAVKNLGYKTTFWNTLYYDYIKNIYSNFNQIKNDDGKHFVNKLTSHISISLFVFLPLFTIFLMLLYLRRNFTYMEHLVFVFNTQTVFFLLLTIFFLLNFIVNLNNISWIFILLFLIYLYKAMRNFYNQSRRKTIFKLVILNSFYAFLGIIGLVIVAAFSFTTS